MQINKYVAPFEEVKKKKKNHVQEVSELMEIHNEALKLNVTSPMQYDGDKSSPERLH